MPAIEHHSAWITRDGALQDSGSGGRLFPYWSFTKSVIAALALLLEDEGKLDLDAPLGLPELLPDCSLRHLLDHSAGLPDYGTLAAYHEDVTTADPPWPRDLLVERTLAQRAPFAPGKGWRYSNLGYLLAREVIESASGETLAALVRARITGPLGLSSVRLAETPADFAPLHWTALHGYHPGWVYHRTLIGTAPDAARLLQALADGRIVPPEALARMTACRPQGEALPDRPWTRHGYALGLMCGAMGDAGPCFGHSGAGPFSANAVYHFPERGVTAACFTNRGFEGPAEVEVAEGAKRN